MKTAVLFLLYFTFRLILLFFHVDIIFSFLYQCTLQEHKFVPVDECPYYCGICHKTFALESTLKNHQYIHNTEEPHTCMCSETFSSKSDLKVHQHIHSEACPYRHVCN